MSLTAPPTQNRTLDPRLMPVRLATLETAADNTSTTAEKGWEPNPVAMVRFIDRAGACNDQAPNRNVVSRTFAYIHLLAVDTLRPTGTDGTPTETIVIQFSSGEVQVQGRRLQLLVDGLQQQRLSIVEAQEERYARLLPLTMPVVSSILFVAPPEEEEGE